MHWLAALDSSDSMMSRYPNLGNHYTLWLSAQDQVEPVT